MTTITLTVLGCGSSAGTPVIGCDCAICASTDVKNHRSRCSAHVRIGTQHWQIDTGPDFRQQALAAQIDHIDGVLYTHAHADHLNGVDDLRAFCYRQQTAIPVYAEATTLDNIKRRFDYAFLVPSPYWNRPVLTAHELSVPEDGAPILMVDGVPIWHFTLPHGRWQSSAFRLGNIAWFTDLNQLDAAIMQQLQGLDVLFLDCLMDGSYASHLSTEQAFAYAQQIGAKQTYFIHMTHSLGYDTLLRRCPPRCAPAYDGLVVHSDYPAS